MKVSNDIRLPADRIESSYKSGLDKEGWDLEKVGDNGFERATALKELGVDRIPVYIAWLKPPTADKAFDSIMNNAGGATDKYVRHISGLSQKDKYTLLLKLAKIGELWAEDDISDRTDKPKFGAKPLTEQYVKTHYKYLKG